MSFLDSSIDLALRRAVRNMNTFLVGFGLALVFGAIGNE